VDRQGLERRRLGRVGLEWHCLGRLRLEQLSMELTATQPVVTP
jgi:hypothetical protein